VVGASVIKHLLVGLAALAALVPLPTSAQALPQGELTAEQARIEFARFGYDIGSLSHWATADTWTTIGSFEVFSAGARSLVLVFPDLASAALHRDIPPEYGVWRANVVIVEGSQPLGEHVLAQDAQGDVAASQHDGGGAIGIE
jgi:hypothetical protein